MNRKINIYYSDGCYICSTTQAKTLSEAKENFIKNPSWQGLMANGVIGKVILPDVSADDIKCAYSKEE